MMAWWLPQTTPVTQPSQRQRELAMAGPDRQLLLRVEALEARDGKKATGDDGGGAKQQHKKKSEQEFQERLDNLESMYLNRLDHPDTWLQSGYDFTAPLEMFDDGNIEWKDLAVADASGGARSPRTQAASLEPAPEAVTGTGTTLRTTSTRAHLSRSFTKTVRRVAGQITPRTRLWQQPGRMPPTIHYWALVMMTRADASAPMLLAAAFTQIVTLVIQFILLAVVVESATSRSCDPVSQTGCRLGEYCSIAYASGQCNDCATVLPSTSQCCPTLPSECARARANATDAADYVNFIFFGTEGGTCGRASSIHDYSGAPGAWSAVPGVPPPSGGCANVCQMFDRCVTSPDTRPRRCDYLVNGAMRFKLTHVILLVGAAILGAGSFATQLDQSDVEAATYAARLYGIAGKRLRRRFIWAVYEFYRLVNNYVLPGVMNSAVVIALLTDADGTALTSGVNVVFSFIALLFISNIDEVFASLFVAPTWSAYCAEVHKMISEHHPVGAMRSPVRWIGNRIIALSLALAVCLEALNMEHIMRNGAIIGMRRAFWGNFALTELEQKQALEAGEAPLCNQVNATVSLLALLLCWMLVLMKLLNSTLKDLTTLSAKDRGARWTLRLWLRRAGRSCLRMGAIFVLWMFVMIWMNGALKKSERLELLVDAPEDQLV